MYSVDGKYHLPNLTCISVTTTSAVARNILGQMSRLDGFADCIDGFTYDDDLNIDELASQPNVLADCLGDDGCNDDNKYLLFTIIFHNDKFENALDYLTNLGAEIYVARD